jgi:hypothetical protein
MIKIKQLLKRIICSLFLPFIFVIVIITNDIELMFRFCYLWEIVRYGKATEKTKFALDMFKIYHRND